MRTRFIALALVVCLLMVFTLPMCVPAPPVEEEEAPPVEEEKPLVKDTLIVGIPALPAAIEPETTDDVMMYPIGSALWGKMMRMAMKPSTINEGVRVLDYGVVQLEMAESWEVSPDHTSITIHLKKGVLSSFGNEFTSEDVLWKWQRGFTLRGLSVFFASTMDMYSVDALEVIDKYTVKFTAERPNYILDLVQTVTTMLYYDSTECKKHATADDPWALDYTKHHLPSFGPYYITEWAAGRQLVFKANPNYYGGELAIKNIIFKVIPESSSRVAMVRDGTIDVAHGLSPREVNSLEGAPGVRTIEERSVWLTHLILNDLVCKPFGNKLVRQAVNYAIDRDKIIETANFGMAEPMKCVFPLQRPGALDLKEFPYDYNIEKGKELMVEAGYADGFAVDLYYSAVIPRHETACIIMREDLAKIGIDVTLRKTPKGTLQTMIMTREVPFALAVEGPFLPDSNYSCSIMYLPSDAGGYCNHSGFDDPEVNDMIMEGKPIFDEKKRTEHHNELQRVILDRAPIGFVMQENYLVAIRDNIEGWNVGMGEAIYWHELSFTK